MNAKKIAESIDKNVRGGSIKEAADFGEIIILAVYWNVVKDILNQTGDLAGKIVIDISNPLKQDFSGLAVVDTSAAEETAKLILKQRS